MKKYFFIGAFSVFLFFAFITRASADECATATAHNFLLINEISTFTTTDWVELYNSFDQCIDLSPFSLWDSTESIKIFPSGTYLNSSEYLAINVSNRLNRTGDAVILKYNEVEWDRFEYGEGGTYSPTTESMFWARIPDGKDWSLVSSSTPGGSNVGVDLSAVVSSSSTSTIQPTTEAEEDLLSPTSSVLVVIEGADYHFLKLNEIAPDPENGNEWVEIYNTSSNTLVADLKICDSRGTVCRSVSGSIPGAGWLVIDIGSGFLNNSGDSAILKDAADNILDQIDFVAPGKGRTWARMYNGTGAWQITTQPTPNSHNIIIAPIVPSSNENVQTTPIVVNTITPVVDFDNNVSLLVSSSFYNQIIINEILPDPDGLDTNEEYLEIKNISATVIDLTGWRVGDKDKTYILNEKISPGGILFWKRAVTGVVLNNATAEGIFLWDINGALVDYVQYDKAQTGKSYARLSTGWCWTDILTPGTENIIETETDNVSIVWKIKYAISGAPNEVLFFSAEDSADPRGGDLVFGWDFGDETMLFGEEVKYAFTTSGIYQVQVFATSTSGTTGSKQINIQIGDGLSLLSSPIIISEVMFDPTGADTREYIELWNNSPAVVDLSGWQIQAGGKKYQLPNKTSITANGFLLFYRTATKLTLVNTGGKVELLAPGGALMDVVKYGQGASGQSYSLVAGEWKMAMPSPGQIGSSTTSVGAFFDTTTNINSTTMQFLKMTIGEAREQDKGKEVCVQGVVTVLPGIFGSQYFYISDGIAGIAIYQYKKDFPPLRTGDWVEVNGVISEASGQKRINIKQSAAIDILRTDQMLTITTTSLNELEDISAGTLVKIVGEITEKKSGYWYVDDGTTEAMVYFKKGTKINIADFLEGQRVEVIGIWENSKSGWQIWPREQDDIKRAGITSSLGVVLESEQEGRGKYFSAAAGAITTILLGIVARLRGAVAIAWVGRGVKTLSAIFNKRV